MQFTLVNSQATQTTSNEVCLNTILPDEVLEIFFDRVVNQNRTLLSDISSILLTCTRWKRILASPWRRPFFNLIRVLNPLLILPENVSQLAKRSLLPLRNLG